MRIVRESVRNGSFESSDCVLVAFIIFLLSAPTLDIRM